MICTADTQPSRSFMSYCPQCGRSAASGDDFYPECSGNGRPPRETSSDEELGTAASGDGEREERVMIARFQNGAEAGYFASGA